jgi:hypothetical protein
MKKEKKLLLIPLVIIGILLAFCWTIILTSEILATWRHYVGLILFIGLMILFFKSIAKATVATGFYLLLGTFNVLALTAEINTSWFRIGPIETPPFQLLSLGLLVLYSILNIDQLINNYLDYKERKQVQTPNRN